MSAIPASPAAFGARRDFKAALIEWGLPLAAGLALIGPTVYDFWNTLWQTDDQAHGPIILAVISYLMWQLRDAFLCEAGPNRPAWIAGMLCLIFGGLIYAIGRSQVINIFELGAFIPLLAGVVLVMRGWAGLRHLWFPIIFIIFLLPLPGPLVDALTGPLKKYISIIAENVLYWAGYPIGREGVQLVIGQYQLLVADACSGLHSMFSLSAVGVLYLYMMEYQNRLRNALIVLAILPIAFVANVIRVMILILVTYYFGDEVGQGFIHGSTGMFLYVLALSFLFLMDTIVGKIGLFKDKPAAKQGA
ncbi:exosortase B [Massilia sp. W12]|uniref:exosortase B n=1 Tax=Massilia sp. W12 TaxID=3126507 RepID=UPI0030D45E32